MPTAASSQPSASAVDDRRRSLRLQPAIPGSPTSSPLSGPLPSSAPAVAHSSSNQPSESFSTPLKYKSAGVDPLAFRTTGFYSDEQYKQLAREMKRQSVGPMPVKDMVALLPICSETRPATAQLDVPVPAHITEPEDSVVYAIEVAGLCPSIYVRNTRSRGGPYHDEYRKCDISGLLEQFRRQPDLARVLNHILWAGMEFFAERKNDDEDGWKDPASKTNRKSVQFEHQGDKAEHTRGQLISYALAMFTSQYRTFVWSILFLEHEARLMRWDRAGVIVSERFQWRVRDSPLAEFLWRFEHSSSKDQGHDTTVWTPSAKEVDVARKAFSKCKVVKIPPDDPLHKMFVYDEATKQRHAFIVSSPRCYSRSLTGRGTSGYIASSVSSPDTLVYLKDSWRINKPEIPSEGRVYALLKSKNVPHIANALYSGDVVYIPDYDDFPQNYNPEDLDAAQFIEDMGDVQLQETLTQEFAGYDWACETKALNPHRHSRLVLDKIGRPITTYKVSRELFTVLRDVAEAHKEAYEKAGTLHRDLSVQNILITSEGEGLLIDWDLVRDMSILPVIPRSELRTGTWQFVSGLLLESNGAITHELHHDTESLTLVSLYCVVRYRPLAIENFEKRMNKLFDSSYSSSEDAGHDRGGEGKRMFFSDSTFRNCELQGKINPHCFEFLKEMRQVFQDGYYSGDLSPSGVRKRWSAQKKLAKSDYLFKRLNYYLSKPGWPTNDGSADQAMVVRRADADILKRKLPTVFYDDHSGNARTKRPMLHTMARVSTPTDGSRSGSADDVDIGEDEENEGRVGQDNERGKGKAKGKGKGKANGYAKGKGKGEGR
ncbi:hypothetical protein OF83DRAFT_920034 [Amylostereum chailletii]|nr:hypothetical protein OF83DRAFT_920034 [Amylostereum chailletii]